MKTISYSGREFQVNECYKCGVEFAMPVILDETCQRDKQEFFCPNGHTQAYPGVSLCDTLARIRRDLAEALVDRDRAERAVIRLKKKALKHRNKRGCSCDRLRRG